MINIAALRAAGLTDAQILAVVEADQAERTERRRTQNVKASRAYRARQHFSADAADAADGESAVSLPSSSSSSEIPNKKESKKVRSTTPRGARLDASFRPTDLDLQFAQGLGLDRPTIDAGTAEFHDYWKGVPGAKGCKLDWPATWRNRMRQIAARKPTHRNGGQISGHQRRLDEWDAARAEFREAIAREERAEAEAAARDLPEAGGSSIEPVPTDRRH
jgi:hypothetical protein